MVIDIHLEQLRGHFADRCSSDDSSINDFKMLAPRLFSGIEQRDDLNAISRQRCKVRAFVQIAVGAGKAKVRLAIVVHVLPGVDVFDVER